MTRIFSTGFPEAASLSTSVSVPFYSSPVECLVSLGNVLFFFLANRFIFSYMPVGTILE